MWTPALTQWAHCLHWPRFCRGEEFGECLEGTSCAWACPSARPEQTSFTSASHLEWQDTSSLAAPRWPGPTSSCSLYCISGSSERNASCVSSPEDKYTWGGAQVCLHDDTSAVQLGPKQDHSATVSKSHLMLGARHSQPTRHRPAQPQASGRQPESSRKGVHLSKEDALLHS